MELLPKNINSELVSLGVVQKPKTVIGAIELRIDYAALNPQISSSVGEVELTQQVETEQQIRRASVAHALGDSPTSARCASFSGDDDQGIGGQVGTGRDGGQGHTGSNKSVTWW